MQKKVAHEFLCDPRRLLVVCVAAADAAAAVRNLPNFECVDPPLPPVRNVNANPLGTPQLSHANVHNDVN